MRLIDANAYKHILEGWISGMNSGDDEQENAEGSAIFSCICQLDDTPTVEAEPVVRCKDCKHGDYDSKPDGVMVCLRTKDGFWWKETDFCSYGERKDNDEH